MTVSLERPLTRPCLAAHILSLDKDVTAGRKKFKFQRGTKMFRFKNGDEVFETYTKFWGVVINRTQWSNGQITYMVQPKSFEGHFLPEAEIFDEEFLQLSTEG